MTTNSPLVDKQCSLRERKKQKTWRAIHDAAFDLVSERGVAHVTVADICASATISERTFFNYFPSKAAAALGLPATAIAEEDERRFLEGSGPLLDELCELIASVSSGKDNLPRMRELIRLEPDLLAALHQWTSGLRKHVIQLAEQRTADPVRAHLAVALVFAALFLNADSAYTTRPGRASAADLRATVSRLGELAAE
ncbi:TetR/AcrR family transcriptional regulator [Sinomonas terrae]|uniref:TetR/AcrR family transcriptional regulator n=1 Tax=Sinomonas terrae TaxID=2908838 RepID=A0ABS9TVW7_9MICC|nr:TetR/AcrR family transcriptional regulator [Sinomonas terrae]MCH6468533.1 TetR/AcrR family transcriptional regulator [Sinomonas terrae]